MSSKSANRAATVLTSADEESVAQPRLEEAVLGRFVDVHVAAEDELDVGRIEQEHDEFGPNPELAHRIKVISDALLEDRPEHI